MLLRVSLASGVSRTPPYAPERTHPSTATRKAYASAVACHRFWDEASALVKSKAVAAMPPLPHRPPLLGWSSAAHRSGVCLACARFYLVDKAGLPTGIETRLELTVEERRKRPHVVESADDDGRRTRNRADSRPIRGAPAMHRAEWHPDRPRTASQTR
jgi:hypothetical protein